MKIYFRPFLCLIFAVLSACGGGNSPTQISSSPRTNGEMVNGVKVPSAPPAQLNATVIGVDGNSDGVRDDVERVLAAQFGVEQNSRLIDLARAYQSFLASPASDAASLQRQLTTILKKEDCINKARSDPTTTSWVRFSVLNTNNRVQAFDDRVSLIPLEQIAAKCES